MIVDLKKINYDLIDKLVIPEIKNHGDYIETNPKKVNHKSKKYIIDYKKHIVDQTEKKIPQSNSNFIKKK